MVRDTIVGLLLDIEHANLDFPNNRRVGACRRACVGCVRHTVSDARRAASEAIIGAHTRQCLYALSDAARACDRSSQPGPRDLDCRAGAHRAEPVAHQPHPPA